MHFPSGNKVAVFVIALLVASCSSNIAPVRLDKGNAKGCYKPKLQVTKDGYLAEWVQIRTDSVGGEQCELSHNGVPSSGRNSYGYQSKKWVGCVPEMGCWDYPSGDRAIFTAHGCISEAFTLFYDSLGKRRESYWFGWPAQVSLATRDDSLFLITFRSGNDDLQHIVWHDSEGRTLFEDSLALLPIDYLASTQEGAVLCASTSKELPQGGYLIRALRYNVPRFCSWVDTTELQRLELPPQYYRSTTVFSMRDDTLAALTTVQRRDGGWDAHLTLSSDKYQEKASWSIGLPKGISFSQWSVTPHQNGALAVTTSADVPNGDLYLFNLQCGEAAKMTTLPRSLIGQVSGFAINAEQDRVTLLWTQTADGDDEAQAATYFASVSLSRLH